MSKSTKMCPKCKSENISYQTVVEKKKGGCLISLLYIILCLTVLGLLIVIPLVLRKKDRTVTYGVCQDCGRRWEVNN